MTEYEIKAFEELNIWKTQMKSKPSLIEKSANSVQVKINKLIPERIHQIITSTIKNMVEAVLLGSKFITPPPITGLSLESREKLLKNKSSIYINTAGIEGAATGAGGFIAGLADFPLLLSIKFKYLYDVASIYGFNVHDFSERLYIVSIFELAFSSKSHINETFERLENWDEYISEIQSYTKSSDWRTFQQEYRDYLDIAKMMQMLPLIGAPVGFFVNRKLLSKLENTAKNAYRMRWFNNKNKIDNIEN